MMFVNPNNNELVHYSEDSDSNQQAFGITNCNQNNKAPNMRKQNI